MDNQASTGELKALRRGITRRIVPMMFGCYAIQFIDKVPLNVSPCVKLSLQRQLTD